MWRYDGGGFEAAIGSTALAARNLWLGSGLTPTALENESWDTDCLPPQGPFRNEEIRQAAGR